jgi:hypothetical protein
MFDIPNEPSSDRRDFSTVLFRIAITRDDDCKLWDVVFSQFLRRGWLDRGVDFEAADVIF